MKATKCFLSDQRITIHLPMLKEKYLGMNAKNQNQLLKIKTFYVQFSHLSTYCDHTCYSPSWILLRHYDQSTKASASEVPFEVEAYADTIFLAGISMHRHLLLDEVLDASCSWCSQSSCGGDNHCSIVALHCIESLNFKHNDVRKVSRSRYACMPFLLSLCPLSRY